MMLEVYFFVNYCLTMLSLNEAQSWCFIIYLICMKYEEIITWYGVGSRVDVIFVFPSVLHDISIIFVSF